MSEISTVQLIHPVFSGFAAALIAPLACRFMKRHAIWLLATISATLTLYFFAQLPLITGGNILLQEFAWLSTPKIVLSFALDGLSLLLSLLISGIGTLILIYSSGYLRGDKYLGRFYSFFFFFMASMLGLVLSSNLILTFIFWELTSIASFFLIGFESHRVEARSAATQALLVTSAGGLAMLMGFILLFLITGSYEIPAIIESREKIRGHALYLPALILIVLGAFTKSAQFPFHFWLPSAMQAPTPVSAYLHSATMVKAGIFLLARLNPVLGGSDAWFMLLTTAGTLTLLTGSFMALQQRDMKLVLAYLTLTALGLLVLLLGIGSPMAINALVAYLVIHALYKGGLFLIAGIIYHATGSRHMNGLSGLFRTMKWTALAAALCSLSMAGMPFFFGFVGKELIYASLLDSDSASWVSVVATTVSMMALTALALLIGLSMFFGPNTTQNRHGTSLNLLIAPVVFALLGVAFGLAPNAFAKLAGAASSAILGHSIEVSLSVWHGFNPPLALSFISAVGGFLIYYQRHRLGTLLRSIVSRTASLTPRHGYHILLKLLKMLSTKQTRFFQSGSLFAYLSWLLGSLIIILLTFGREKWLNVALSDFRSILYYEWVLGFLMILGALNAAKTRLPLVAVVSLGVLGYAIALTYVLYGAPDLAMTQFLVETMTVIVLALVLSKLPEHARVVSHPFRTALTLVLSVTFGILMTSLVWNTLKRPLDRSLSDFFSNNSVPLAHGRNIVNVILVDFRALDTLGEITVLGVAALGIFGLVRIKTEVSRAP
ncbi:MAG TPA: hydrogen gas-evolving membrane-bound hydrogenase subunit E [Bdellovibrionota bacterium]|nr:hydrogen gas-evolving membrane-bound hydrogenase subunit E [Bdellovibrionota bacterium]